MDLKNSVTSGTTWINAATTLKAFGQPQKALPLYEKAWRAYSGSLDPMDYRFAGLSNNMALAYVDMGEYAHAGNYYEKAMSIMKKLPGGSMEMAVTYVNLACMYDVWVHCSDLEGDDAAPDDWDERIWDCLDKAMEYLDDPQAKRDGYYAFTCSKCAGTFGYFGQFRRKKSWRPGQMRFTADDERAGTGKKVLGSLWKANDCRAVSGIRRQDCRRTGRAWFRVLWIWLWQNL